MMEWFKCNYIESENQCLVLLDKYERKYNITRQEFYQGCMELRNGRYEKELIETHLRILGEICNYGVKASIAGAKMREALIETYNERFNK